MTAANLVKGTEIQVGLELAVDIKSQFLSGVWEWKCLREQERWC